MTKKGIYSVEKICEKFLMRLNNLYKALLTLMVDARIIIWRASKMREIPKILLLKIATFMHNISMLYSNSLCNLIISR